MKRTVVISGGSDGLGKTLALHFRDSFQVVILSPSEKKLKKTAQEVSCQYVVCDVSDYDSCQTAIYTVVNDFNSVDILVNNAGLWIQGELETNEAVNIKQVIDVNALGVVNLTKAVVPQMKKQHSGVIININSQAGLYAKEDRAVYNLTKWGITGFTKSIQPELAKYGIRVSDIHPGKMKTEMFAKMGIEKNMDDGIEPIYVAQAIEFIINLPPDICVPELGIKHILG